MTVHTDVPCSVCGCVCDDLLFEVQNHHIVRVERACTLAQNFLEALDACHPPTASCQGESCTLDQALTAAAGILRSSRAPLVFGLARGATNGHRLAVQLAERLGAVIDIPGRLSRAAAMAMQQVGLSTCTLGEVRQRADLVIFWGADPLVTHPRHLERYSAEPTSEFLPRGRADRTLVVIADRPNATSQAADFFLQVSPGRDLELAAALRQLIRSEPADFHVDVGIPMEQLRELAARMKTCRYGALFFGTDVVQGDLPHLTVESLIQLVTDLNQFTRFTLRELGQPGGENVLTWQTGFPLAVDFRKGFPRYGPHEFSANAILLRGEADGCVLLGSDCVTALSAEARSRLAALPTIVLDPPHQEPPFIPAVRFTTAVEGIHTAGTTYRLDGVPIPLRQICLSPYESGESILGMLLLRLPELP